MAAFSMPKAKTKKKGSSKVAEEKPSLLHSILFDQLAEHNKANASTTAAAPGASFSSTTLLADGAGSATAVRPAPAGAPAQSPAQLRCAKERAAAKAAAPQEEVSTRELPYAVADAVADATRRTPACAARSVEFSSLPRPVTRV